MLLTTKFVHKFIALMQKAEIKKIKNEKNEKCFCNTGIVHRSFS